MFTTHQEMLEWLAVDNRHADRFMKSIDKIIKGSIVLVVDEFETRMITAMRAFKKNRKVRK